MTATAPTRPAPPVAAVGTVSRLKLTEPLRFYCWPAAAFLLAVLLIVAAATGEWSAFLLAELPALVMLLAALEAARGSVYCTRGMVQAVMRARQ